MKKFILISPILFYILLFLYSCNSKNEKSISNDNIIAFIDSYSILYEEIDNNIRQEIFDELNRIYLIRKIALDEAIQTKVLEIEANKLGISSDSLGSITENLNLRFFELL